MSAAIPHGDELKHLLSTATLEDRAVLEEILDKVERNQQRAKFVDYCCSKELFAEEKPSRHQQLLCPIIKSSYWRKWPEKEAPICEYIVQSIDGAYEEGEESDYSARTTWGIFDIFHADNSRVLEAILKGKKRKEVQRYHAILVEAWRGKVPFSTFKRIVQDGFKEYEPDRLLIEKKASGISLIQELRKGELPITARSLEEEQGACS